MLRIKDSTITCWFSCGVASAIAAKKTIEFYGHINKVIVVNNPITEEHPDNRRFLKDVEAWLGQEILTAKNIKYPDCSVVEVWDKKQYMSGINGAPCTVELKKNARYQFEQENPTDYIVLGFTVEEKARHERLAQSERVDLLPILIKLGLTKNDCFKILRDSGLIPPKMYGMGFSNANCLGCVKATSPSYWNLLRKFYPEIFKERAEQSRRLNAKLVRYKGERIFLDELPENVKGRQLKSVECSIFCDSK